MVGRVEANQACLFVEWPGGRRHELLPFAFCRRVQSGDHDGVTGLVGDVEFQFRAKVAPGQH